MLKDTLLKFFKLDGLASNFTAYVETRVELLKLEIKEDIAKALAKVIVFILMAFVFTLFVFFISTAAAYKLGEFVGPFGGFSIVAGMYLIIGLIVFLMRDTISKAIEKQVLDATKKKKE
jgi:hypothetical protein